MSSSSSIRGQDVELPGLDQEELLSGIARDDDVASGLDDPGL